MPGWPVSLVVADAGRSGSAGLGLAPRRRLGPVVAALASLAGATGLIADQAEAQQGPEPDPTGLTVTSHRVATSGGRLDYTATAGFLPITDAAGTRRADVFFVAYSVDPETTGQRPMTFAFNGGPGQPAVWLHLGVGPVWADVAQPDVDAVSGSGMPAPPHARLVPNPATWLTHSDLVFVDPVSTGYSRAAEGVEPSEFHGYVQDVEYLAEFVRLFLTRFDRWDSPRFLLGESYGTTRVGGLARYLQERHGITVNGVILVSAILNWQTARFDVGNDLPHLLYLPTYTATAWYHGRLSQSLQRGGLEEAVREAREFATGDYAAALLNGPALSPDERQAVAHRLAALTGLSPEYVERTNLRIHGRRFAKELLRSTRTTVGRLDSRYVGVDRDAAGEVPEYDPSYFVYGAFSTAFHPYVRRELGVALDRPYEIRAGDLVRPWDYTNVQNRYLNVAEDLRRAMSENPALRLFVASGYYDLATPFFAMDYTLGQMQLDERLGQSVTVRYYEAGHMMYIDPESRDQLETDIGAFYRAAGVERLPR